MKKLLTVLMTLMMLLTAAGCNSSKGDSSTIKIGGTGPLTGGAAIYGTAVANAAAIAVEEVNALGGFQFELKYEDDQHDTEKAVNAFNALMDWGMQISLSSVTTAPAVATSVLNAENKIFGLTPSASAPAVTEGKDNVFQMCFSDPNQGTASAQYIAEHNLGRGIAVIYKNDDPYSTGVYETFMAEAKNRNLNIVSVSTFTSDSQNDFSVQITDARNSDADLVFLPIYYEPASLILTQCDASGYNPLFFGVDGMDGILTMKGFNTALAEGVMLLTPFSADASDSLTKNFVAKYQERYGDVPNQFAADAYDSIYALYNACKAAGITADMKAEDISAKLVEQFTTMTFKGLTGNNVTWDASGAVSKSPKAVLIKNGAYVGLD